MFIDEQEINQKITLEEFLQEYKIEYDSLSEKDKLKILRNIVCNCKIDKDWLEIQYTNHKDISEQEFVSEFRNIELKQMQAQGFIFQINNLQREYKKEKRKETRQKIKSIFSKK